MHFLNYVLPRFVKISMHLHKCEIEINTIFTLNMSIAFFKIMFNLYILKYQCTTYTNVRLKSTQYLL